MPLYCGVNGVKHEVKHLYCGVGSIKKELTEMWAGIGGVKRQIFNTSVRLGDLPIGAQAVFGTYYDAPITWLVADHNHEGYPENSTTLISEKILTLKCIDALEPNNPIQQRREYGNNRYIWSNIRQWLNKSGTGWYQLQHAYDRPPSSENVWYNYNGYDKEAGFLTGFSSEMLAAILTTTLTVARTEIDGGGSDTFQDKVFLLSMTEAGFNGEFVSEGSKLALFTNNDSRKAYLTTQAVSNSEYVNNLISDSQPWFWALRTPDSSSPQNSRRVHYIGVIAAEQAFSGTFGVRPALNLPSDILVSGDGSVIV